MATNVEKKHILCLGYPAYGHTIPLLELCRKLAPYHHVTFAVSKYYAERMRDREFKTLAIDERVARLPIEDGVPADADTKVDTWEVEHERIVKHIIPGVAKLMQDVAQLNQGKTIPGLTRPVDVVIFDMFLSASVMDNRIAGVKYYYLNTPPAYFIRYLLMLKDVTERCPAEEQQDFFQDLPPAGGKLPPQCDMLMEEMGHLGKYVQQVDGVICNSYRAGEQEDLAALDKEKQLRGIKFFCLGPLLPPGRVSGGSELDTAMLHWLDKQKPRSVVYITFGSVTVPTEPQLREIAQALLNLGVPFIWSLRKGHEEQLPEVIRQAINKPMNENRNFWVVPWVAQNTVLNHPSTGACLSHCGWNSALDCMAAGVPVLSWPLFADHRHIGRFLVKRGVALMIQDTDLFFKHLVPAEEIQKSLGTLLTEHTYRDKMEEIKREIAAALSKNGSSTKELEEFAQFNV